MKKIADLRLLAVLLCCLVAAGCASLAEMSNLSSRIEAEGYTAVSLRHDTTNGFDTVSISADKASAPDDDGGTIARLVWDTYPEEVDRLVVTVNGKTGAATYEELEKAFGARKVAPRSEGGSNVALVLALVLGPGVLGVIVLLIVRDIRRRRAPMTPPPPHQDPYDKR